MSLFRIFALSALALSLGVAPAQANTPTGQIGPMLMVRTSIGLPEAGFPTSTLASVGTPEFKSANAGYKVAGKELKVTVPTGVAISATFNYDPASPPVGSNILQWAAYLFSARTDGIAAALKSYAATKGLSGGIYTYQQSLRVQGRTTPMTLFWQIVVTADGRHFAQDPQLIPSEIAYLQYTYTPKRIAAGLDSSWAYPNAGKLSYRLIKQDLTALTADTVIDTNGAFDAPVYSGTGAIPSGCTQDAATGEVSCSQDFGVRCLIDKTSSAGCPSAYPDMKSVMSDQVAVGGILDYGRSLSPVFDEVEDPPGSGEMAQVPRVAVTIDSRSISKGKTFFFISPGGGKEYIESGTIGYELRNQTDRYRVQTDGTFELGGQATNTQISPTSAFSKKVLVQGSCSSYQPDKIIDPFSTTQVYDWHYDTVNSLPASRYISVATLLCN